jgi:hypothetical protein
MTDRTLIMQAQSAGMNVNVPLPLTNDLRVRLQGVVTLYNLNAQAPLRYVYIGNQYRNGNSGVCLYRIERGEGSQYLTFDYRGLRRSGNAIVDVFERLIAHCRVIEDLQDDDRAQVVLVNTYRSVSIPMMNLAEMTSLSVLDLIYRVVQSDERFDLLSIRIDIKWVRRQRFGAYSEAAYDFQEFVKTKKSIIAIDGSAGNCFFQCCYLHLLWLKDQKEWSKMVKRRKQLGQATRAMFPWSGAACLRDMKKWEDHFKFGIRVIEFQTLHCLHAPNVAYDTVDAMTVLCDLGWGNGHVHYVKPTRVGALWNKTKYCTICNKGYQEFRHKCESYCPRCRDSACIGKEFTKREQWTVQCAVCNFQFANQDCYRRHLSGRLCRKQKQCTNCFMIYDPKQEKFHICGFRKCANCKEEIDVNVYRARPHICYHQPIKLKHVKDPHERFIFYDFECAIGSNLQHHPVYVAAMYGDGPEMFEFTNVEDFVTWLLKKEHKGYIAIAHNAARYDAHFIKKVCIARRIKTRDITKGRGYIEMYFPERKLRLIDSYCFIPIGLRAFGKTFGLTQSKGFFPYRFFTPERLHYIGELPDREWFDVQGMRDSEREEFNLWYAERTLEEFDLFGLCREYCMDDVRLLKAGCMKYRQLVLDATQGVMDPFHQVTLAATAMKIFRVLDLTPSTIGVLQSEGMTKFYPEHVAFLEDLKSMGYAIGVLLPTEKEIIHVSGLLDNEVKMYQQCVWDGCMKCYKRHSVNPYTFQQMFECKYWFDDRVRKLREAGFTVSIVKECEFVKHYETSNYVKLHPEKMPVDPRDAFFGGRTEYFKHSCTITDPERYRIQYYDFTSLYPAVLFGKMYSLKPGDDDTFYENEYPIGHPTRHRNITGLQLFNYFGFARVRITPPEHCYLPLLPRRSDGKLIFDVTPQVGTWTTVELKKAVEVGYLIEEVFEVLHFPRTSKTLFRSYISRFLTLKYKASGWEKLGLEEASDEEKETYLRTLSQRFGVNLQRSDIGEYNPGMYAIAKLYLNSLWGKFAQRAVTRSVQDVFDTVEFEQLCFSDQHSVSEVFFHDNMARTVTTEKTREFTSDPRCTNVALAAFTTAYARLRLYEALELLGDRVLYCDTDSVIFVDTVDAPVLKTGPFLGDLTDELSHDDFIVDFAATAPKSYAYRTFKGKEEVKLKGFNLTQARDRLNLEVMKHMVLTDPTIEVRIPQLQFDITERHDIFTHDWGEAVGKVFSFTGNKRKRAEAEVVREGYRMLDTQPFHQ